MSKLLKISNEAEITGVIASKGLVLVDFYADWCGPCKMLAPVLEEIAGEYGDELIIAKVNIDVLRTYALANRIESIPTLLLVKNGEAVAKFVGYKEKEKIKSIIDVNL